MTDKIYFRETNFNLSVVDLSCNERASLNPVLTFEHAFSHYPEILEQIYKQRFVKPSPVQVRPHAAISVSDRFLDILTFVLVCNNMKISSKF